MKRISLLVLALSLFGYYSVSAQTGKAPKIFTHADTVRGSVTPERAWWKIVHYAISVTPDYDKRSISGENGIRFRVLHPGRVMQIDLQEPMNILSITWRNRPLKFKREGNAFYVLFPEALDKGKTGTVYVRFAGHPREAVHPPWDGGWVWTRDKEGRPWISAACQDLGASSWYPCKDYQGEEPDSGASLSITAPDTLVAIGNGRLKEKKENNNGTATYTWAVVNPINNYDIIPYIGKYVGWHEDYAGEKGKLDCDFWVLDYNLDKARKQFREVDTMLHCFEYWMGPYPFYEDGYKLVEAPYLGMEHQSAIAYGNGFGNGYLGKPFYGTEREMKWDFILVHESGHEWFGNNITAKDIADMWIHEGFTTYAEALFTTCQYGVEAGNEHCIALRGRIQNDKPVIGPYGVNEEGSADMYGKAANMLHIIRQIIGDDSVFRGLLRGLNATFYHQTVNTGQIEDFIDQYTRRDFSKVFDQYLRTTQIPVLEYKTNGKTLSYRWTHCVKGFDMPVKASLGDQAEFMITPMEGWQRLTIPDEAVPAGDGGTHGNNDNFSVDRNFYIGVKKTD